MSSSSRSRVPSAVGVFLVAFSSRRLVAGLSLIAAIGGIDGLRATPTPAAASVSVTTWGSNGVRVTFNPTGASGAYDEYGVLFGGDFINLTALSRAQNSGVNLFSGSIVSITANVNLESFAKDISGGAQTFDLTNNPDYATTANDLAIYIGVISPGTGANPPTPPLTSVNSVNNSLIFSGGLLQVGGTNGTGATPWPDWSTFNTSGTPDSQLLNASVPVGSPTPITLTSSSVEEVWLANAYTSGPSFGRWSGTIDFTFAGSGGSGVPDASRTALLLAPGTLLLLGLAGRSRRRG